MTKPYEARVRRGAALLDKVLPNWWNGNKKPTIILEILDMENPNMCVLGQCFGDYKRGCNRLGIPAWSADFEKGKPNAKDHGFLGTTERPWRREIENRRKEAGIS